MFVGVAVLSAGDIGMIKVDQASLERFVSKK
jgi:hypothetical protein